MRHFVRNVCASALFVSLTAANTVLAQEMTHLGTVVAVETGRIQVRMLDDSAKPAEVVWFVIDSNTRFKRGDRVVTRVDAKIAKGERVAVLMDPAAKTRMLATEIRLGPAAAAAPAPAAADPHAAHQQAGQKPMESTPTQASGWTVMQDGVVNGLFNRQGGPRGGREFVVPNWWMGMATKEKGRHHMGLNAMLSLDPATVGSDGYREIFQVGEALDGKPLIDRQHPHDFIMQLAALWQIQLGEKTAMTFAGGPAGEPTLGPVAFMHRPSASGLVMAPLGHHTFDSTHISYGVVSAGVERGPWTLEASVFNGREPDQHRWDFDFGRLDSAAVRVWFRPNDAWEAQVSTGWLRDPEELVPGDARRTTASLAWFKPQDDGLRALTFGYGVNDAHDERRHGFFGEYSMEKGANSVSGRLEFQQVETEVLLTGQIPDPEDHDAARATVTAATVSATRRLVIWRGFEGALGAQISFYGVPDVLKSSHGRHPVSFQVFFRLRLPTGGMGRMWNMRMSRAHVMDSAHAGHVMR